MWNNVSGCDCNWPSKDLNLHDDACAAKQKAQLAASPARVGILNEAALLTAGDREQDYGPPLLNAILAGSLKQCFRTHATRSIGPAEMEFLDMILTKLSRIGSGPAPKRDNYVDGAAYFGLAFEVAMKEYVHGTGTS